MVGFIVVAAGYSNKDHAAEAGAQCAGVHMIESLKRSHAGRFLYEEMEQISVLIQKKETREISGGKEIFPKGMKEIELCVFRLYEN